MLDCVSWAPNKRSWFPLTRFQAHKQSECYEYVWYLPLITQCGENDDNHFQLQKLKYASFLFSWDCYSDEGTAGIIYGFYVEWISGNFSTLCISYFNNFSLNLKCQRIAIMQCKWWYFCCIAPSAIKYFQRKLTKSKLNGKLIV